MPTIYTVSKESLLKEAESLETYAKGNLNAWCLLGQTQRYHTTMGQARAIRAAAHQPSIWLRREILRNLGYSIQSIKTI